MGPPQDKTAQGGERELTARQLRCACGVRSRPMCPAHAAMRHVSRLKVAGFWRRGGPLFPDAAGATWAKGETVMLFRRVLLAAGVTLTTVDHEGRLVQLFAGHAARVAGAAWLASKGVPTAIIQLLGRWSSTAVERYVQGRVLSGGGAGAAAPERGAGGLLSGGAAGRGPAAGSGARGGRRPDGAGGPHLQEKGTKVHRPDPAEASTEPFLWRSRCGAWPYGIRRFFRVSEKPAAAAWCARCFPAKAGGDGEGSPSDSSSS